MIQKVKKSLNVVTKQDNFYPFRVREREIKKEKKEEEER